MEDLAEDIEPLTHKPAFLYNEIALTYLESEDLKKDYTEAEILAKVDTNVKMAWSKIDELKDYKPRDVTVPEWNLYGLKVKSDLYLTQYKLNLLKNDSLEASKSVYEAISNAPHQMNALLYKEALNLNLKYGDAAQLRRLIEFAYSNDVVDRELQNYILGLIGKGDDVDINFVNGLIAKNTAKHNLQLKNSLIKGTQLSGFVQTPEKTFVDLESLKGKIKIISINSTWCDVCTQVYPILNEIYAKYQTNTNVSVIGLSVWEDDEPIDAVNEMIGEFKIKFPYYIDNTDIIPRKYDVFGFPTILIVDKDNYVRYTIRGFANGEELVKLIDGFVNMLN
jgi:thiol-disulfide isomerase/thioredoxin